MNVLQVDRETRPPTSHVSPKQNVAVIRPPQVEEPSQLTTTTTTTTSTSSTTTTTSSSNCPPPPPLSTFSHPSCCSQRPQPASLCPCQCPRSPDRILTTHVLTHLIEGFVIREGLEPFPVGPSSLLAEQQLHFQSPRRSTPTGMQQHRTVLWMLTSQIQQTLRWRTTHQQQMVQCELHQAHHHAESRTLAGSQANGRRGRPPSRVNGASREHFLRRVS
ncbi:hypothetical protein INR49_009511 [Caranx melampygus]|nr:hypothetical protein INR49_009511 [Caranx melampygus]